MKILTSILAFGLLLASTLTANANDYALLNTYPLLNDMKMAKKEQLVLNDIHSLINDRKNNNKTKLIKQKEIFTTIMIGLATGDNLLGLHGTELICLKNKIHTIQLLWSQEQAILDSALNNKMYVNDAYEIINQLSLQLSTLNKLYKQSYKRYKQNSIIKSLVSSYMKNSTVSEPMYAINIIK